MVLAAAAVVAVAPDHDALVRPVLLDVVGAGAGERPDSLGVGWERRRDGAEERHRRPGGEVAHLAGEADDERVAAGRHAGGGGSPACADVVGADDRLRVEEGGGFDARRHGAVDRVGESAGSNGRPVAEAEAAPQLERGCPAVGRDRREGARDLWHHLIARGRRFVAVPHQAGADRVQQRPALARVGERGVDVVEGLQADALEADFEDPTGSRRSRPLRALQDGDRKQARNRQAEEQQGTAGHVWLCHAG